MFWKVRYKTINYVFCLAFNPIKQSYTRLVFEKWPPFTVTKTNGFKLVLNTYLYNKFVLIFWLTISLPKFASWAGASGVNDKQK